MRQPHGPIGKTALPMTIQEAEQRGWTELDVVFVTGDAYIDHPSFAMAILDECWKPQVIVLASSANRIGNLVPTGNGSASRVCSMRSARATWTR